MAKSGSAAKGAAYAAENVAGQDILPQAGKLYDVSAPVFQQYINELLGLTSTDPSMRMEANVATIGDLTSLAEGQKKQVMNQPRGGAQTYELGLIDQNTATQIGKALSATFNQALGALGQVGEFGIGEALSAETAAGSLFTGASGAMANLSMAEAQKQQGIESMIAGLAAVAAGG